LAGLAIDQGKDEKDQADDEQDPAQYGCESVKRAQIHEIGQQDEDNSSDDHDLKPFP
jgi:hypothetical protein